MTERMVQLSSIQQIKDFVNLVTRYPNDFDLVSGRYTIDAKSIMGIFSLDLTHPLRLCIYGEVTEELLKELAPYLAEDKGCETH